MLQRTTIIAVVAMPAIAALLELVRGWFVRQHYPGHPFMRNMFLAMRSAVVALLRLLSALLLGFLIAAFIARSINEAMPEDGFAFGSPSMLALFALGTAIAWFSLWRWVAR